jgi:hypothetical protein
VGIMSATSSFTQATRVHNRVCDVAGVIYSSPPKRFPFEAQFGGHHEPPPLAHHHVGTDE